MTDTDLTQDKFTGCLLGGAIGDALGAPVEFSTLEQIREQFGSRGIADFYPAYGRLGAITDDTQMTLFTAEGLLRGLVRTRGRGIFGAEVAIVHGAYLRWLETQDLDFIGHDKNRNDGWLIQQKSLWARRAPGNTCLSALRSCESLGNPVGNDSKGCGTVMRVAPVGLIYGSEHAYKFGTAISELTHGHPTASISAGAICLIISLLREDVPLEEAVQHALEVVIRDEEKLAVTSETSNALKNAISLANINETPSAELIESFGGAWVAEEALAISVYCALVAKDFADGVLLAVNHSGDSDSTGAITGNLLGFIYGQNEIPLHWQEQVECRDEIQQIASDLVDIPENYFPQDGDNRVYCDSVFDRYPGC